jgi:hypothetical protein
MAVLMTAQLPGATQERIDGLRPVLDEIPGRLARCRGVGLAAQLLPRRAGPRTPSSALLGESGGRSL